MDIIEAIKTRKSIRGYTQEIVPKEVLKEILEAAIQAPSSMNTQPWEFTVIAGDVIEKIKAVNIEKFDAGETGGSERGRDSYADQFRKRQVALAVQLFQLMDIQRGDREKRTDWMKRGIRFFDAPAAIIISIDESLGDRSQFDIGSVSQTIALAALNYGLGTCMMGQGIMYPEVIREFTGIPESKHLVISLAIGYPDWEFPANEIQTERESIEDITRWCGL